MNIPRSVDLYSPPATTDAEPRGPRRGMGWLLSAALLLLSLAGLTARADTFYVTCSGNDTIERFSGDGTRLTPLPSLRPAPTAIALDDRGDLYVGTAKPSDPIDGLFALYPDGTVTHGLSNNDLNLVNGLVIDGTGILYIANSGSDNVEKLNSRDDVDQGDSLLSGLNHPTGLAADGANNLYVANYGANTIVRFSATGENLGTFASTGLSAPYALAFDAGGNLYVSNLGTNSVRKFSSTGADLGDFIAAGTLAAPTGLTFDADGDLLVVDEKNRTIDKFSPAGAPLGVFGTTDSAATPTAITRFVSPDAGTFRFRQENVTNVSQSEGTVTFAVSRIGGSTGAVSVTCATADATAIAGTDYTATSTTLSWADGDTADKNFPVPIINRQDGATGTETFYANLSSPSGGTVVGNPGTVRVDIADDGNGAQPSIAITSPPDGITVIAGVTLPIAGKVAGASSARFYVNGSSVGGESATAPVASYTTPLLPGAYVITASAFDYNRNEVATAPSITINVIAPPDATPPRSEVLTPLNGHQLKGGATVTICLDADATSTAGLDHLNFYADGTVVASFDANGNRLDGQTQLGAAGKKPLFAAGAGNVFQFDYTLPDTQQDIDMVAVATDTLGHSTVSQLAIVSVVRTVDDAPVITLTGVTNGMHVPVGSPTKVSVAASGSSLNEIGYYLNGDGLQPIGDSEFDDFFTPPSPGKYVLQAVAYNTNAPVVETISAPVTVIADAAGAAVVTVATAGDGMAIEGGEKGKVIFERTGDTSGPLTVYYKLKGSAVAGVDYKTLSGSAIIPAGASRVKIKIKPIDNTTHDGTRKAKIKLLPATDGSYTVGDPSLAKVKVIDND